MHNFFQAVAAGQPAHQRPASACLGGDRALCLPTRKKMKREEICSVVVDTSTYLEFQFYDANIRNAKYTKRDVSSFKFANFFEVD